MGALSAESAPFIPGSGSGNGTHAAPHGGFSTNQSAKGVNTSKTNNDKRAHQQGNRNDGHCCKDQLKESDKKGQFKSCSINGGKGFFKKKQISRGQTGPLGPVNGKSRELQHKSTGNHNNENMRHHQNKRFDKKSASSKAKNGRKPKNTTDFKPRFEKPDLRVRFLDGSLTKASKPLTVHDVTVVPKLFCAEDDLSLFQNLVKEIIDIDPAASPMTLWHGDSHYIANDRHKTKWKEASPSFKRVVERIETYFGMKINATRFNYYREISSDWKPFHRDRAAFTPGCPQNLTVAASFGCEREVGFEHCKSGVKVFADAPNGSAYTFGRDVNIEWKHGVIPTKNVPELGRISIICWGIEDQDATGSRITENAVPSKSDLGL